MAEEFYDDEDQWNEPEPDSGDDGGGDFNDGTMASGVGRGDPGRDEDFQKLQAENERLTERGRILDRFEQDPEGVLRDTASRLGMELVPRGQQSSAPDQDKPPAEFLAKLGQRLPDDWKFLGDVLGPALWDSVQEHVKPLQEQQTQQQRSATQGEVTRVEAEMDAKHPDWRTHERSMNDLYKWLQAPGQHGGLNHPKFGSVYEAMYKLATGNTAATRQAASRMRDAAQNATSVSDGANGMAPDVDRQMSNAKSRSERYRVAFRAALAENGVR